VEKSGEMMTYSIKEIASLAGVTTRTIRYYDQIGLLLPASIGDNGYRIYDTDSLLRLQQILFFRELDVPLKNIEIILNQPEFLLRSSLEKHRLFLERKVKRLKTLIKTIDITLEMLKGKKKMTETEYFNGFDESLYEDDVKELWGKTTHYKESSRKWANYSKDQKDIIKNKGKKLTIRMVGKDENTVVDDPDVQQAIGEYFAYLNKYFYTCDVDFLRKLANMWVTDARFAANYERIRKGGAVFVREAVHYFCDNHS
jgi:MerR family transcriptional regulator, thiopeptide resistance regulator